MTEPKRLPSRKSRSRPPASEAGWSAAEQVIESLRDDGWEFPQRPRTERPSLDDIDVDQLNDRRLMDLFTRFTAWAGYTETSVTAAKINVAFTEAKLKKLGALELIRAWDSGEAQAAAKARRSTVEKARAAISNPEIEELEFDLLQLRATADLLETLFNDILRSITLVSRELTRRGSLDPNERRAQTKYGV